MKLYRSRRGLSAEFEQFDIDLLNRHNEEQRARYFMPAFGAPFASPIAAPGGAAAVPWYLSGGVSAASCVAAYKAKGAASLAASYVNLANPGTNDAAPGVAPTFSAATGWTFNGTTQYLTTGLVPPNDQSWSMLAQISTAADSCWAVGASWAGGAGFILNHGPGVGTYYNGGARQILSSHATGNLAIAGAQGYWNGSADGAAIPPAAGTNTYDIWIGALNNVGSFYNDKGGNVIALAIYNALLTAPQVAAIAAAMAAI